MSSFKDVTTRWNSFDDTAKRALYLQPAINELTMDEQLAYNEYEARCQRNWTTAKIRLSPAILQDWLNDDDWHVISLYHEILQPTQKATKDLQGHAGGRSGAIWQVISVYEDLLAHFEDLRQRYPINDALLQRNARQKQLEDQRQSQIPSLRRIALRSR